MLHTIIGRPYKIQKYVSDNLQNKEVIYKSPYLVVLPRFEYPHDLRKFRRSSKELDEKYNFAEVSKFLYNLSQFIAASRKVAGAIEVQDTTGTSTALFTDTVIIPESSAQTHGYCFREQLLETLLGGSSSFIKYTFFPGDFHLTSTAHRLHNAAYPFVLQTHLSFEHIIADDVTFSVGL